MSLPKWQAVACRLCRRLVLTPKLRHLCDSYLIRHTVTAIITIHGMHTHISNC